MMPIDAEQEQVWSLLPGRRYVRLQLPPLPVEGLPTPINIHLDFDAGTVAAWSALPATRGAAVQGAWRLFLSRVLRKSHYESQRRSRKARAYLQAYRIRQRLDGSRPVVNAIPSRPRGIELKTYGRLCTVSIDWSGLAFDREPRCASRAKMDRALAC